jgi:hypothetical protein
MTTPIELRKSVSFGKRYKDVGIEAVHHSVSEFNPNGIWCGYIYLNSRDNPEIMDRRGEVIKHDYHTKDGHWIVHRQHSYFDQFNWNGGITFYEETVTIDGQVRMKIGHDYAHSWDKEYDRDRHYDEKYIIFEMEAIADAYCADNPKQTGDNRSIAEKLRTESEGT